MRTVLNSKSKSVSHKVGQIVLTLYFLVMTVIYPYYAPGGYLRIGEVKYVFFRNVTLAVVAVMAVIIICSIIRQPEFVTGYYRQMSVTDWFAYGYFVVVMVSYLCSSYKEEAFWGTEGWYMGTVMQMVLVLLYFLFSRYFMCHAGWLAVWLAAAAGVFILGILNRYSIYPIAMEGRTPVFISTLGNINWFCGYWSVTAAMGMALYWCSKKRWQRVSAGGYSVVAMLAGVVQGSESAYLVFAVVFVTLLLFSVHHIQRLYRWMELGMIFMISCQLGRILRYLPGFHMNYGSEANAESPLLMERLTDTNITLWALCILLAGYVMLRLWERKRSTEDNSKSGYPNAGRLSTAVKAGKIICGVMLVFVLCVGLYGIIKADGLLYERESVSVSDQDVSRIKLFHEDWGNGRGTAWNCSIEAYGELDTLHKIVGAGPDCFAAYIYEVPALAGQLAEAFGAERLTNAHNEWLSILINMGALGLLWYIGFVGSALVRYNRNADRQPLLYVCEICLLAYTVHNMVSFQQVLNTPFFFILLGMGEGLLREIGEREYE